MKNVGYVLTYGVDGFGADVAPAIEEGFFFSYENALKVQMELNKEALKSSERTFYESGYGEDYFPDEDLAMAKYWDEENWEAMDKELAKHELTDLKEICLEINSWDEPPFGMYKVEEIEIRDIP